jgi:NADPH:quinone reductase-like Zn-dependent oxidoreductase
MSVKAIAVNPENPSTFIEITPPMPQPGEHDLLVEVKAVSVNPVDTKVHAGIAKKRAERAAHSRMGCQRDRQSRWGWRDRIQTGR